MLRTIITSVAVAQALNALPILETEVMDEFYPASMRQAHPHSDIRISELQRIAKAVPVVLSGTTPVDLGEGDSSTLTIEPQPIDIVDTITPKDLLDVKSMDGTTKKVWVQGRVDYARQTVRATTEALCIQSLSGQINFPLKIGNGTLDTYTIKFGDILLYTPSKKLSADDADIGTLLNILRGMAKRIKQKGAGTKIVFKVSEDVFDTISKICSNIQNSSIRVEMKEDTIIVAGYTISVLTAEYYDPATKTYKKGIADKTIKAIAKDSFGFRYLAIHDIEAGLKALPIFVKPILQQLPSAWVINTKSTPLPIPNPNGICDAVVL